MLQNFLMPVIQERMPEVYVFQQDFMPYHCHNDATSYLNVEVPVWIGGGGVISWLSPPPQDFSVWGFVTNQVYTSSFPTSIS
ncbi:uncharacterized protein TNCV_3177771 [Trichonephila clavipes]|nr:uncharacterized protein TNCV_3177771 [Trichonephila clavipes]